MSSAKDFDKESIDQLDKLSKTARFLKKNNFEKLDETSKHFHSRTLSLKDEDLEYEWRLKEIADRKRITLNISILATLQTIIWTMVLGEVNLTGKIVKLGICALVFLCHGQVYYLPRVKENKKLQELVLASDGTNLDRWDEVMLKLSIQKECQRQFVWYQLWWFMLVVHQVFNDLVILFQPDQVDMTPADQVKQSNVEHFMIAVNLFVIVLTLQLIDIHWIYMGGCFAAFTIWEAVFVYHRLNTVFIDYVIVLIFAYSVVYYSSFQRIKTNKLSFLKSKKTQSLLKEQVKIFQHLPDGALIYRKHLDELDEDGQELRVQPDQNISMEIKYLNLTFQDMFTGYREKLRQIKKQNRLKNLDSQSEKRKEGYQQVSQNDSIRKPTTKVSFETNPAMRAEIDGNTSSDKSSVPQSIQNDENSENVENNDLENEKAFLSSIYLQKSPYKINDKFVEQIEEQVFQPELLIDALKEFESGQVYSVMTKDEEGNFSVLNKDFEPSFAERVANQILGVQDESVQQAENGYLIYIVSQEVIFNEEISTVTYFRDITFGVLYEQVKAQQQLQNAISQALQSKMGVPLKNIVDNCTELEQSDHMKKFETTYGQGFTLMVRNARIFSNLMVFYLKDMQDWNQLKNSNFRQVSSMFVLPECIMEVYEMMSLKASIKQLNLQFLSEDQIPVQVIGDKSRLQQILINLVQNAITHTSKGLIEVLISFDRKKYQIQIVVKDTGIGIKSSEQVNVFKVFGNHDQIGLGLTISREIAQKYRGDITFFSEHNQGSSFTLTMDLEEFVKRGQMVKIDKNYIETIQNFTTSRQTESEQLTPQTNISQFHDQDLLMFGLNEELKVPHHDVLEEKRKQASKPKFFDGQINESDIFAINPGSYPAAEIEAESVPRAQVLLESPMGEDTLIEDFGQVQQNN